MNAIILAMILLASTAFAQNQLGGIAGMIKDPEGAAVPGISIEVKNAASNSVSTTTSSSTGTFSFSQLVPGTYQVTVPALGFRFDRLTQDKVAVAAGQISRVDLQLQYGNQGVVGDDDAFLLLRNKYPAVAGPAPRTPDGKPDFSGVWHSEGIPNPESPRSLGWVDAVMKERTENHFIDMPSARCLPGDIFPSAPLLYKNLQTDSLLVQIFEAEPHYRQVFLDGRGHPNDPDPTWMGHSIGKWDGDTLIIDTVGLNDKGWLPENRPHTDQLHIIERYRRPDLGHLNIDVTIEDPGTFTKPWDLHMTWQLAPGEEILETICSENNKYQENIEAKSARHARLTDAARTRFP